MVDEVGLNQAELQMLVRTQAPFQLVARSFKHGRQIWWKLDVVLSKGETVTVCKARRRHERKVWKQLSALQRFVQTTVPEVENFTVSNAPAKLDRQGTRHDKKKSRRTKPRGKRS